MLLSVPCEGRKMCLAHAFSLWQRGGSAALQMARVPCMLVGRLIDTQAFGVAWFCVVGRGGVCGFLGVPKLSTSC